MSTEEGRKLSYEEVYKVQDLIEQCLLHYMNQKQVMHILYQQQNIEPTLTETIWQQLEEQNPEFFKSYYLRLVVNDQIMEFNNLLGRQAALMNQVDPSRASFPPVFNSSHMAAMPHNSMSGFNSCGPSGMQHGLDRSTHCRRMDFPTSNMVLAYNSNMGMEGIEIKSEPGYLDNSRFFYRSGGNVLGAHPTIEHGPVSAFGNVDPNSQRRLDDASSFEYFRQITQNIGLPGLAADFTNRSDALRFSNSAFPLPEIDNFFDSQGNTVEHQGPTTCRRM